VGWDGTMVGDDVGLVDGWPLGKVCEAVGLVDGEGEGR